jgi:hypothetical protein
MIKSYFRSLFVFVGLIVIFQILVLWVVHPRFINLVVTEWSDEQHFLETIRLFASGLTLDNLKHYEDMSGPLFHPSLSGFVSLVIYNRLRAGCYLTQSQFSKINSGIGTDYFRSMNPYL